MSSKWLGATALGVLVTLVPPFGDTQTKSPTMICCIVTAFPEICRHDLIFKFTEQTRTQTGLLLSIDSNQHVLNSKRVKCIATMQHYLLSCTIDIQTGQ